MANSTWNHDNIPNQQEKVIIITGASSGLGKEATKVLASKQATVVMAVRNVDKARVVLNEILHQFPNSNIDIKQLDLSSLDSIRFFANEFEANYNRLDILINNAGVMMCPFSKTIDGFEIQMGVNHLGHFALTGLLMPLLKKTINSRIVVTSSVAHKTGNINFEDLNWEKRKYATGKAYSDSKLANLYFTYELVKRLKDSPDAPLVTASHPGWTKTELDRHTSFTSLLGNYIAQTVEKGTLPTLRAAIDNKAKAGDYFGPAKLFELRGAPVIVKSNKLSYNKVNATKLWALSEKLTGVHY